MSLWANIRKRRASGKPKLKPGQKGYPKTLKIEKMNKEEITTTANIPNPAQTAMGPTGKGMTSYVHDRRKRKKDQAVMLKRFRDYFQEKGVL